MAQEVALDTGLGEDRAEAVCNVKAREGFSVCKEEQRTGRIAAAMQVGGDAGNWAERATSSRKKQPDSLAEGVCLGSLDKKKHARGPVKMVHRQVTDEQVNGGIKARGRGGEFADAQETKPGCREGCPEHGTIGIGEV